MRRNVNRRAVMQKDERLAAGTNDSELPACTLLLQFVPVQPHIESQGKDSDRMMQTNDFANKRNAKKRLILIHALGCLSGIAVQ